MRNRKIAHDNVFFFFFWFCRTALQTLSFCVSYFSHCTQTKSCLQKEYYRKLPKGNSDHK